ncbi:MAG TPA: OB-fold nucleic acid binding domain-containing protein [Pseudonocardiaceae bacterium]|nr:OB-fold nucleic acid binding domain-containing protein [Pseudonocardiaceae bacterium]
MSTTTSGYWRRLMTKLSGDADELETDDLSRGAEPVAATPARDCQCGVEATVRGRVRSVEVCPHDEAATVQAELYDGTESVTLVWLGRRRIAGIEPGRTITATGRMAVREGRKVMYNPYYELQSST